MYAVRQDSMTALWMGVLPVEESGRKGRSERGLTEIKKETTLSVQWVNCWFCAFTSASGLEDPDVV